MLKSNKIRFAKLDTSVLVGEQELLQHIEILQTRKKLHQFATFIPDEILHYRGLSQHLRHHRHFVGVLLCLDIAGIFAFIEKHCNGEMGELYKMTVNLNAYIGSIIEVLHFYGGDILSINGNNFVSMWKCPPDDSIHEILHIVIVCASVLQRILGVYTTDGFDVFHLKTVISCGNISYSISGNINVRRTILIGDAFKSVRPLLANANYNQVVITNNSIPHMIQDRYKITETQEGYVIVTSISYTSKEFAKKTYFDEKYAAVIELVKMHNQHRDDLINLLKSARLLANIKMHSKFIRSLPARQELLRVIEFWTIEEMQPLQNEIIFEQLSDSQPGDYLTERKEITCLYIRIVPEAHVSHVLDLFDEVFLLILNEIALLQCDVQHVYATEVGIMFRILFGMMVTNRESECALALQLARKIKKLLQGKEHLLCVSAGVSSGTVFCGVVGHPLRREYVVIGRPIFKARRLATMVEDKVLCDVKVFRKARLSSLYFKSYVEELDSNGEKDYFIEYNECFDQIDEEFSGTLPLVDRISDFNLAIAMIQSPSAVGFDGICFSAAKTLGKSMLLLKLCEETRKRMKFAIFVTLIESLKYPYYAINEIYRQIYDQVYKIRKDIQHFLDLPRDLLLFSEDDDISEDIAVQKYRTLNTYRDIILYANDIIVLFIDDIQFIDVQSWEILELTLPMENIRLILSCNPLKMPPSLIQKLKDDRTIKFKELLPLKDRFIAPLARTMLQAKGVSHNLIKVLVEICRGNPGYVECLLLRLLNNGTITVHYTNADKLDYKQYYYDDIDEEKITNTIFSVVNYIPSKAIQSTKLSMETIYLDVFYSMPTFSQLVVKTAALIGMQFGRELLKLTLNLPSESNLAEAIKKLFEEKLFKCASLITTQRYYTLSSKICCACYFDQDTMNCFLLPKYAYCKLMQFQNEGLRKVAYQQLPANQRHELHVMCTEVLERVEHICPNCLRNPSNYYAFLGNYDEFLEFCRDPSTAQDHYLRAKDSYESIKEAIKTKTTSYRKRTQSIQIDEDDHKKSILIDEKYIPFQRHYNPATCRCLEILHVVYKDLIRHSSLANEITKTIFYKLKFGLIQMCMRDIIGAMKTLHETRELSLVDCHLKLDNVSSTFRKYHVGKASIALALCNLKVKNISAAKGNIMLALRQYNVPFLAFSSAELCFLFKRRHLQLRTIRPYRSKRNPFGWELGSAMFICAKVFALENKWKLANDCCKCAISLMKANNSNIAMLLDTYSDAMNIYSTTGDQLSCERLQKYLVREFQMYYAKNDAFSFHMLFDMLSIILELNSAKGQLKETIGLGYRFIQLADRSKVLQTKPSVLTLLCELNLYNLSFRNFQDLMQLLYKNLTQHKHSYLYYYVMCMLVLHYTGFFVKEFTDILKFSTNYFESPHEVSESENLLKLLIHVHLLRSNRYDHASKWEVEIDFYKLVRSNAKTIKMMTLQLEAYLLKLIRYKRMEENPLEDITKKKIKELFKLLKEAVDYNIIYRPLYLALKAWYLRLKGKKSESFKFLKKMEKVAEDYQLIYFEALAIRIKNHWEGGFLINFNSRPVVSIQDAQTYSFGQFAQYLHSYILE